MPRQVYGDPSINLKTDILEFDLARSGGIYKLGFPSGLTVLFSGSVSLSDTERLRKVDWYAVVSVIFDYSSQIRTNLKDKLNHIN